MNESPLDRSRLVVVYVAGIAYLAAILAGLEAAGLV